MNDQVIFKRSLYRPAPNISFIFHWIRYIDSVPSSSRAVSNYRGLSSPSRIQLDTLDFLAKPVPALGGNSSPISCCSSASIGSQVHQFSFGDVLITSSTCLPQPVHDLWSVELVWGISFIICKSHFTYDKFRKFLLYTCLKWWRCEIYCRVEIGKYPALNTPLSPRNPRELFRSFTHTSLCPKRYKETINPFPRAI